MTHNFGMILKHQFRARSDSNKLVLVIANSLDQ